LCVNRDDVVVGRGQSNDLIVRSDVVKAYSYGVRLTFQAVAAIAADRVGGRNDDNRQVSIVFGFGKLIATIVGLDDRKSTGLVSKCFVESAAEGNDCERSYYERCL